MAMFDENDKKYMMEAIRLAEKGRGRTYPNPMVGAVIVKGGKVLSRGYHHIAGSAHAEIDAIKKSPGSVERSTMYVTLEPCTVHGKTPPCVDSLIKYNFKEVVIGAGDPNPEVNGSGIESLRNAGIKVRNGLFADMIAVQNEVFFKHIKTGMPFVCAKIASSIDGKLATGTRDSKWITSLQSRKKVQKLRKEYGCVLTGINTVLADDPTLFPKKNIERPSEGLDSRNIDINGNFYRVILDSSLQIPADSNIVKTAGMVKTIIFSCSRSENKYSGKVDILRKNGITLFFSQQLENGGLDICWILETLYKKYKIAAVLLECGPILLTAFLKENQIDKFIIFLAPKIIGGDHRFNMFKDLGVEEIKDSIKLEFGEYKKEGPDLAVVLYPLNNRSSSFSEKGS